MAARKKKASAREEEDEGPDPPAEDSDAPRAEEEAASPDGRRRIHHRGAVDSASAESETPESESDDSEDGGGDSEDGGGNSEDGGGGGSDSASADGEDEEEEEEEGDEEEEEEEEEDDEEEGGEEDDEGGGGEEEEGAPAPARSAVDGGESCSLDLRNLTALNPHQVDSRSLYAARSPPPSSSSADGAGAGGGVTIPPPADPALLPPVDESILLERASEGCTLLLERLWGLDTERTDVGPMARLPNEFVVRTPRELPPPPPRKETKWEKFARERGIGTKGKRSQKVWDEATQSWMYRHGYRRANDASKEWPIMEVRDGDDPHADPWERVRDEKKSRVDRNVANRMKNQERAGALLRGTANRTLKDRRKARELGRAGGAKDKAPPGGVPVDMQKGRKRGKELTRSALAATQRSTASLGKFDKMREGEPERNRALAGLKKRKFESATDKAVVKSEASRSMKLLETVISGGGVKKQRAIRKGEFAKGETAYDYDYDDGLGASTFRKKKGRAGAGKMKKMTKKRAK